MRAEHVNGAVTFPLPISYMHPPTGAVHTATGFSFGIYRAVYDIIVHEIANEYYEHTKFAYKIVFLLLQQVGLRRMFFLCCSRDVLNSFVTESGDLFLQLNNRSSLKDSNDFI